MATPSVRWNDGRYLNAALNPRLRRFHGSLGDVAAGGREMPTSLRRGGGLTCHGRRWAVRRRDRTAEGGVGARRHGLASPPTRAWDFVPSGGRARLRDGIPAVCRELTLNLTRRIRCDP